MNNLHWQGVRDNLLHLHKVLLEYERKAYEGKYGKVASPGALLGLVMENPQFAWLRQLSGVVVGIDEMLESKEPVPEQNFKDTLAYIKKLLVANQGGNDFEKNYYAAMHNDPAVPLAHSKMLQALEKI